MAESGLHPDQVAQVRGFADQRLRNPKDPLEASNRRVSIIVQYLATNNPDTPDADAKEEGKSGSEKEAKPSQQNDQYESSAKP